MMGFSPAAYSLVLDRSKIDYMVVYPTAGLFMTAVPELSAETAAAYRRAYNRWLGDFCGECDGRVIGDGTPDELRRASGQTDLEKVFLHATATGNGGPGEITGT